MGRDVSDGRAVGQRHPLNAQFLMKGDTKESEGGENQKWNSGVLRQFPGNIPGGLDLTHEFQLFQLRRE